MDDVFSGRKPDMCMLTFILLDTDIRIGSILWSPHSGAQSELLLGLPQLLEELLLDHPAPDLPLLPGYGHAHPLLLLPQVGHLLQYLLQYKAAG